MKWPRVGPEFRRWGPAMDCMFVPHHPTNAYGETLIPSGIVFGGGPFGR